MSIKFSRIELKNWRQFQSIKIDLHPRLTILTGANGAGKSTIINLFSQHFGYSRPYLSTLRKSKTGKSYYDPGYNDLGSVTDDEYSFWDIESARRQSDDEASDDDTDDEFDASATYQTGSFIQIGSLTYSNGIESTLGFQEQQVTQYGIQINGQQPMEGVSIGSHRFMSNYQPVNNLPIQSSGLANFYHTLSNEINQRLNGGHVQHSTMYRMKEAIITMAAFGEGNHHLEANAELLDAYNKYVAILKKVLPKELGFQSLVVRIPDLVLKTKSGEFVVDSSSGGIAAIMEIAWQVHLYSLTHSDFVVTLDEPENHLHPSLQRTMLSDLVEAFPKVQFIVATHSPFIVSAVEDSTVYALKYTTKQTLTKNKPRRVRSILLDQRRKAGTASEILKEVLGVQVSIPNTWKVRLL